MERVRNAEVWNQIRIILLGSAILFLINIFFGFDNAVTTGVLPRSQSLLHLHAGSIGWITLISARQSRFGCSPATGRFRRRMPAASERLAYLAIGFFAGYIISFGLAFSQGGDFFILMPIFGTGAMLMIWISSYLRAYAAASPGGGHHGSYPGRWEGCLLAAVGCHYGSACSGWSLRIGRTVSPHPSQREDRVGVHAGMMDTYLIHGREPAIVEWFVQKDPKKKLDQCPGLLQAVSSSPSAGVIVPIAFLTGLLEQLLPIFAIGPAAWG